ncbi:mannose-P-dolichol utilization defect 1 protein [Aulographum hederae CBS 113979]|uniref:Mannose-P-dolichol utilization defect 1 protein homolog n=1 Tax=Aulographum hederae CBS 113979 TaxID=1176131 RepID=A0A6G1GP78_9PEZI|nr:mannose-P-dolichol utilization defect 1 protein [Aulographum hederae CBS 113979]
MDTVRSVLQPITHKLPKPLFNAGINLLGPSCYKTIVMDIDPASSPECMKLALSKGIGIAIVGASSIVKLPQLLKLLNSRSPEGVSFLSYLLETSAFLIGLAYNVRQGFPFSTYGETVLIMIQNVAITVLVLHFAGKTVGAATFVAGLAAAGYALFNESIVDAKMMTTLQTAAGILGISSKLPQIWEVYQKGGTGQLSAFAVFNYLLGSLMRIFTTLQEVDDPIILYGFFAGFVLNGILAAQMAYYWNSPASKDSSSTKLKNTETLKPVGSSSATSSGRKSPSTRRRG